MAARRITTLVLLAAIGAAGAACSGGSSAPHEATFVVGGTVSGLWGPGLVLATPGQPDVAVPAGAASFAFAQRVADGTAYAVTVKVSPAGMSCAVAAGTGHVSGADAPGIAVTCGCATTFAFAPSYSFTTAAVRGDWDGFAAPVSMAAAGGGARTATLGLSPGAHAYQLEIDGVAGLDDAQGRRAHAGGVECSAVKVPDCRLPSFEIGSASPARPSAGAGTFDAALVVTDGVERSGLALAGPAVSLEHEGAAAPLSPPQVAWDAATGALQVHLSGLADGKYRLVVSAASRSGRTAEPLRLPFWIEARPFDWRGAVLYSVVPDRFADGDPTNDGTATAGVDPRADWAGGDLEGLRAAIAAGVLDVLGVDALVLSPPQTQASGGWLHDDGVHLVTGFDGSLPVRAREVEPRLGGAPALRALVSEAHRHGIRVVAELNLREVHQDHEYVAAHPGWFRPDACVCGAALCDWTAHALDCNLRPYLPSIDHTVDEATAAFVADAVWWLDAFDLDGLRVRQLTKLPAAPPRNLAAEVRETLERGGVRHLLLAANPATSSSCGGSCPENLEQMTLVLSGTGPLAFGAAADTTLYGSSVLPVFAYADAGLLQADSWQKDGISMYPAGTIRSISVGSVWTPRFATQADYADADRAVPYATWTGVAGAPADAVPYDRARLALTWLLTQPGAPDLEFGDEYGQWGSASPNGLTWRAPASLTASEAGVLAGVRKAGAARRAVPALRTGAYVTLSAGVDVLVFGRVLSAGQAAIVGINRLASAQPATVNASALGLAAGTALHDHLGGPNVTVGAGGSVSLTIPARDAVILAP